MAIGAYTAAISFTNFNQAPFLSLVAAVLVSAISGLLIGFALVRFTGAYLSGTTLALAFSLPALLSTSTFFGAGEGIEFALGNPLENSFVTFQSQDQTYFAIGALAALISLFFIFNIVNAKYGRIWKSIRDNEVAAALNGINVNRYKLMAFSLSSGFSGLAGALFAISINAATPSAFPLSLSLLILTGAVVTGLYNLKTVVFGAFVVVILPSLAEAVVTGRENSERLGVALPSLLVSGLLVLTILVSPNGPAGIFHKKMTN
jgi:branched-chain amino acid transport system permease protein